MDSKQRHDFLFQLYDYADYVASQIQPDGDSWNNNERFLTLVLIERFFDFYGRGEISKAAREANLPELSPDKSLAEAHRRIDALRRTMDQLVKEYDFNETLDYASEKIANDWRRRQP